MKTFVIMLSLLVCVGRSQAQNAYIDFSGVMRGDYDVPAEAWRFMIQDNYTWKWFEDCCFTATVSNVAFMQGKDLSKLVLKSGMDGLATPYLKWFRKTGTYSDHRLYCDGAFTIAYDRTTIVEGACDIEVDVAYLSNTTAGHINGQISGCMTARNSPVTTLRRLSTTNTTTTSGARRS